MTEATSASGVGIATITDDGKVLDTWFPAPELGTGGDSGTQRLSGDDVPADLASLVSVDEARGVSLVAVRTVIGDLSQPPADAHDVYLRLHLLSHRLIQPHGANLDGQFGLLSNVVWTNFGPCAVDGFEMTRARLKARGPVAVYGVDKFPAWSTMSSRRASASAMRIASVSVRTSRAAPPSCTRGS